MFPLERAIRALMLCLPLALAACATTSPPAVVAPPRVADADGGNTEVGPYKVGSPYQIEGIWYYPSEDYSYSEEGIASWYGQDFHGKRTANGERYDMNALTAAHPTLPLPSMVKVTNLDNGRVLAVRVNDRGPFHSKRIIDLSRRAAQMLGLYETGTARVRVEIDATESMNLKNLSLRKHPPEMPQIAAAPRSSVSALSLAPLAGPIDFYGVAPSAVKPVAAAPIAKPKAPAAKVPVAKGPVREIYIQAGAFSEEANARKLEQQLGELGHVHIVPATVNNKKVYRVRLGPVGDDATAGILLGQVKSYGYNDAKVVRE